MVLFLLFVDRLMDFFISYQMMVKALELIKTNHLTHGIKHEQLYTQKISPSKSKIKCNMNSCLCLLFQDTSLWSSYY